MSPTNAKFTVLRSQQQGKQQQTYEKQSTKSNLANTLILLLLNVCILLEHQIQTCNLGLDIGDLFPCLVSIFGPPDSLLFSTSWPLLWHASCDEQTNYQQSKSTFFYEVDETLVNNRVSRTIIKSHYDCNQPRKEVHLQQIKSLLIIVTVIYNTKMIAINFLTC